MATSPHTTTSRRPSDLAHLVAQSRPIEPRTWAQTGQGLYVPARTPRRRSPDHLIGIDLFAGAGGFSLGMKQAGVHVAVALELAPWPALTYLTNLARPGVQLHFDTPAREAAFTKALRRHLRDHPPAAPTSPTCDTGGLPFGTGWIANHPDVAGCEHFFVADARNITGTQLLDALGVAVGEVGIVFGGPPCQGFSKAGRRDVMDPRNSLLFEFARLVLELRPAAFAMENVEGLLSMVTPEGVGVLDAFCRVLADGGFGRLDALKRSLLATANVNPGMALRASPDQQDGDPAAAGTRSHGRHARTANMAAQPSLFESDGVG